MKAILYLAIATCITALPVMGNMQTGEESLTLKSVDELDCSKYGPDEAKTKEQYSLYHEFYKQKNYEDAIQAWRWMYNNASGFHSAVHAHGIKMYEEFAKKAEDNASKQAYLDTMFMVYDARLKCFGEDGDVYGRKAIAMYKYRPDKEAETYEMFNKAIALEKNNIAYFMLTTYFSTGIKLYVDEALTDAELIELYFKLMDIVAANKASKKADKYQSAGDQLDEMMGKLNLLTCDLIKPKLQAKYDAEPDNEELWEKIYSQMRAARCATDPLFVEVTEKLMAKDPDDEKARILAINHLNNKNYTKAMGYSKQRMELTGEKLDKADAAMDVARIYQAQGDFVSARNYADQAASLDPSSGEPYLLIGDLYQGSGKKCGSGTGWDSQVVTWAAIDMYEKAKKIDSSVATKANNKIANSRQYMPSKEECFFRSLNEGDSYKIDCWIGTTTSVRFGPSQ